MTLAEISYWSRQTIKYGFFFLVFVIVGGAIWKTAWGIYRSIVPPAPAAPTIQFGKLSGIPFPRTQTQSYQYTLQTPTGELPKLPPSVVVYLMPQFQSSFLGVDEATSIARNLGFTGNLEKVSSTVYRFEHTEVPKTLDINIVNKMFSISYNLGAKPELLFMRPSSTEDARRSVESYLGGGNLLSEDYKTGQIGYEYLRSDSTDLVATSSLSEASFVRVNFFRKNYAELPVVTPRKTQSNVWFIVSGEQAGPSKIVAGEYHHFPIDETKVSTYPIKTADQAWKELQSGKAAIVKPLPEGQTQVTIRRIYLAYYDAGEPQQFFQPVFVFEDGGGFAAYLPAVTDEHYSVAPPQE